MIFGIIDDYFPIWIVLAFVIGILFPVLEILQVFSTVILAIMVGSISLTISIDEFNHLNVTIVIKILILMVLMPIGVYSILILLNLPHYIILGFLVLFSVTPELVTPTMTKLADGNVALSSIILIIMGILSLLLVPGVLALFTADNLDVDLLLVVRGLLLAVVLPLLVALALRHRFESIIRTYDNYYPTISSIMVLLIMSIVSAANSSSLISPDRTLILIGMLALAFNLFGYLMGWLISINFDYKDRVSAILCIGMRDFAVASALILSANLPVSTTQPAIIFGLVELITSSLLAMYLVRQ